MRRREEVRARSLNPSSYRARRGRGVERAAASRTYRLDRAPSQFGADLSTKKFEQN
jgi:hypothetical protein